MTQPLYPLGPNLPWVWSATNLTALTGGPSAPGQNGVHAYSVDNAPLGVAGFNIYVTYVALNKCALPGTGEIHQLQFPLALAAWQDVNLTKQGNSVLHPLNGYNPAAYLFASQGTFHVFYLGEAPTSEGLNLQIDELWQDSNGWHHSDLTGLTRAPTPSLASPSAYTAEFQQTQHVIYIGVDGHINELWWRGGWYHNDLTNAAGAPLAAVGTSVAGFVSETAQTQNVHYVGQDGQLHGVRWQANSWQRHDAVIAGGVPPAAPATPAGYFSADGVERVAYIGLDGHLRELSFDGTAWQMEDPSQDTNVLVDTDAALTAYPGLDPFTRRVVVIPFGGAAVQQFSNSGGPWSFAVIMNSFGTDSGEAPDSGARPGAFAAAAVNREFVFFASVNFNITALSAPSTPVIE
jgi:hypothetical protein